MNEFDDGKEGSVERWEEVSGSESVANLEYGIGDESNGENGETEGADDVEEIDLEKKKRAGSRQHPLRSHRKQARCGLTRRRVCEEG